MSVQSVFVVAAVPLPADIGLEERKSAFWLKRLFGSGRKRKLSRDIGTSITEEELHLESPPGSPRCSACRGSAALPDLVTSCHHQPAAVFVFPEGAGSPSEPGPELRCRLAGLDGAGLTPRGGGGGGGGPADPAPSPAPAPAPADAELLEVGRCLRRCADEFGMSRRAAARSAAAARPARPLRVERLAAGALVAVTAVCFCRRLCK